MTNPKIKLTGKKTSRKLALWADAVEQVKHLNMDLWLDNAPACPTFAKLKRGSCGFAACALGTAAVAFAELAIHEDDIVFADDVDTWHSGYGIASAVFGITPGEAERIIYPANYAEYDDQQESSVPKAVVVERIRGLAAEYRERGL